MNGLQFSDEAARQLEKAYLSRDVIAQRSDTIRHLSLSAGERVLDIGCGPGFLCESMGEIVGPKGAVVGIDISTDLIARCNGRKTSAHLSYEVGDATKLNQPNASFDVVVCTQVAEYVANVDRVFSQAFRVLKPNGHATSGHQPTCSITSWRGKIGKAMRKIEPRGWAGNAESSPECRSMISRQSASPNPIPRDFVVTNASKMFSARFGSIPGPESSINRIILSLPWRSLLTCSTR